MAPCVDRYIDYMHTFDATGSHAAPDHAHDQIQALRLEFFLTKSSPIRVGLVAKPTEGAFIAEQHVLLHLTYPAG